LFDSIAQVISLILLVILIKLNLTWQVNSKSVGLELLAILHRWKLKLYMTRLNRETLTSNRNSLLLQLFFISSSFYSRVVYICEKKLKNSVDSSSLYSLFFITGNLFFHFMGSFSSSWLKTTPVAHHKVYHLFQGCLRLCGDKWPC
jgi:hypothetical protein